MVKPSFLPHVQALHAEGMMSRISSDTAAVQVRLQLFRQSLLYPQHRPCRAQASLLFK